MSLQYIYSSHRIWDNMCMLSIKPFMKLSSSECGYQRPQWINRFEYFMCLEMPLLLKTWWHAREKQISQFCPRWHMNICRYYQTKQLSFIWVEYIEMTPHPGWRIYASSNQANIGSDNDFSPVKVSCHYLNQILFNVDWSLGNNFHWDLYGNNTIFIEENGFEYVYKIAVILSGPHSFKMHTGINN